MLQAELANGLAGLLLVPVVDGDGSACGDVGLAGLRLGVRLAGLDVDVLHGLIGDFFDTGVGHFVCRIGDFAENEVSSLSLLTVREAGRIEQEFCARDFAPAVSRDTMSSISLTLNRQRWIR